MTARDAARSITALLPRRADYAGLRGSWRRDLLAGLTVGIVALPLALGFGISSGMGAEAGLVTAVVAGLVAAVFGGSHVQVSGPTGAMVVVLAPVVASEGAGAVALVTVLAGVLVVGAGALRLGRLVSVIPWPVIEGFTLGIAVIIALQQAPSLTAATHGDLPGSALPAAVAAVRGADPVYLAWTLGAVAVVAACMVLAPRVHAAVPGSLVGIAVVAVAAAVLPTPLTTIGALPRTLPPLSLPGLDPATVVHLLPAAVTVAALAAIESLLSARVAASLADTGPVDADRELVGQGLASVAAGVLGGMPATGAIARTAVNVRSGARTRLAAVTHAVVLAAVVLVAAGPVGRVPLAALAGVLLVTAVRMVHGPTVRAILRSTRSDAVTFVATAVVTVSVDLVVAVGIGVVVAGLFALRNLARASRAVREPLPGPATPGDERIALVRIDGPLFFAAADRLLDTVTAFDPVSVVVIRLSHVSVLDATGAHTVGEIVERLERRGVTVLIKGVRDGHVHVLRTVGALAALRHRNHLFTDLDAAVAHARDHVTRERTPVA